MSDYNPSINPSANPAGWIEPGQPLLQTQDHRAVQHQVPTQAPASSFQFPSLSGDNYTYSQNGGSRAMPNGRESHLQRTNSDMDRLQTLVAVATSENTATSAY